MTREKARDLGSNHTWVNGTCHHVLFQRLTITQSTWKVHFLLRAAHLPQTHLITSADSFRFSINSRRFSLQILDVPLMPPPLPCGTAPNIVLKGYLLPQQTLTPWKE